MHGILNKCCAFETLNFIIVNIYKQLSLVQMTKTPFLTIIQVFLTSLNHLKNIKKNFYKINTFMAPLRIKV